ncbi:hypothetical protein OHA27_00340 [Streptomyces sp. NBC_01619]|uniref:DUF6571 family protein n=1 Tax=Streptomyces sp. NBC_01619 TaxID=2975901 RepID=UPI00224D6328|nr:DUF6571 family protein [Streptomyces sp. NBC_01619]MCX4508773.1 hypothetical protein [Streptomyces sp. NBC_01619]
MGSLTLTDLVEVDLGKLGTAVADWKKAADNLKKLASSADSGMYAKSERARWRGDNATVTRDFVRKTKKEFADAQAQAQTTYQLLEDAHTELVGIQKKVQTAVGTDAANLGCRIEDIGGGAVRWFFPRVRGDSGDRTDAEKGAAQALADRVTGLIGHATEIDASVSRALGKSHGNDPNFGHTNYDSLDAAQEERAAELAQKSLKLYKEGKELSEEELKELRTILKYNADDQPFATKLYRDLGPEGALRFQAQTSLDGTAEGGTQLQLARSIQDSMGIALATAQPKLGDEYTQELMKLGRSNLDLEMLGNRIEPKGYQVLGTLLRHGTYEKDFLDKVGNDMIAYEREMDGGAWSRPDGSYAGMEGFGLNADATGGGGWDPLTGLLEAYGRNPDASTAFLQANVAGPGERMTNLDYLMGMGSDGKGEGARTWIPDATSPMTAGEDKVFGKDALGHALEAATTGMPFDHGPVSPHPEHTPERLAIMEKVVNSLAGDPKLMDDKMADSMGRMAGEYMPEINNTLRQSDSFADLYGHPTGFNALATTEFLDTIGRNPESYAEATLGAENYSATLMHQVVNNPDGFTGNPESNLKHIAYGTGTIEGILGGARHDEIVTKGQLSDQDYNDQLQKRADMFNAVFGSTVGLAAERVPIAGEIVTGVTETVVGEIVEGAERNTSAQTAHNAGESSFNARENAVDQALNGLSTAGTPNGVDPAVLRQEVDTRTGEGYDHGKELHRDAKDHYKRNPPK